MSIYLQVKHVFMEWTLVVMQVAPGGVISGLMQDVVELLVSPSREEHVALVVGPPPLFILKEKSGSGEGRTFPCSSRLIEDFFKVFLISIFEIVEDSDKATPLIHINT